MEQTKRYKKGHFLGIGIAIGLPIGMPIGLILGNIAYGPVIGSFIGIILGIIMERRLNINPIFPSSEELLKRNKWLWISFTLGMLIFSLLAILYIENT